MNKLLNQYFTPEWAAIELVHQYFSDLSSKDKVLEPSCGPGAFLKAIPDHIHAVGVEIDPALAELAAKKTGRQIICGDFKTVKIDFQPTAIIGNPPYKMDVVASFLDRAQRILPNNGRCGLLLSSYLLQTPSTVVRWSDQWSMEQSIVPRTLFPRAIRPLVFVMFRKDLRKIMVGFSLYRECNDINMISKKAKLVLVGNGSHKICWRELVEWSLKELGGEAALPDIYKFIQPRRPTSNPWWKEKVRQQLQAHCRSVKKGTWQLNEKN